MARDEWSQKAANLLKAELKRAGVGYEELSLRLKEIGIDESYKGIASKITRGMFSFAFFMQCMKVINKTNIILD